MKKLILIPLLLLFSCGNWDLQSNTIKQTTGVVLKKEQTCYRGCNYRIYLFDGESASWLDCDEETFHNLSERDSIKIILVTKTYLKK